MKTRSVRTYKLQLSGEGITLFLACHCRLALTVGALLPYGTTLSVAVSLLDRTESSDIAAALETPRCQALAGNRICFVGASTMLAEIMSRIRARLGTARRPRVAALHRAALLIFEDAGKRDLLSAYRDIRPPTDCASLVHGGATD